MSDWDKFLTKYKRAFEKMAEPVSMILIGEFAASKIRLRTRLGYGVAKPDGNNSPLAKLKQSTVDARKKKNLFGDTRPGFSNLTETGQLLDSIKVVSVTKGEVSVGPEGARSDGKNNRDIGVYQTQGDSGRGRAKRPFNNLSKAENRAVRNFIAKIVTRFLKSGS